MLRLREGLHRVYVDGYNLLHKAAEAGKDNTVKAILNFINGRYSSPSFVYVMWWWKWFDKKRALR